MAMPTYVATYLSLIRNDRKRNYGYARWHAIVNGSPYPERPDGLSYMAAQAVDMDLAVYNPGTGRLK